MDGEEINLFLEDPLIVGEVTLYAETTDEVEKLIRKSELIMKKYGRMPRKILVILTVRADVLRDIKRMSTDQGIELIVGKASD